MSCNNSCYYFSLSTKVLYKNHKDRYYSSILCIRVQNLESNHQTECLFLAAAGNKVVCRSDQEEAGHMEMDYEEEVMGEILLLLNQVGHSGSQGCCRRIRISLSRLQILLDLY